MPVAGACSDIDFRGDPVPTDMTNDLFAELYPPRAPRCTVRLEPQGRTVTVERGTTLLEAVRAAGLPSAQSCGGFAICSWCRMRILAGAEHLSPIEPAERRLIERQGFAANERASCQAEVRGDVTATTTYW